MPTVGDRFDQLDKLNELEQRVTSLEGLSQLMSRHESIKDLPDQAREDVDQVMDCAASLREMISEAKESIRNETVDEE